MLYSLVVNVFVWIFLVKVMLYVRDMYVNITPSVVSRVLQYQFPDDGSRTEKNVGY
jgi:hypothetical protein